MSIGDITRLRDAIAAAGTPSAGPELFVALDIDGTVLRHNNTLAPRVGEVIRAHIERGTHICLATGRGIHGTHEALDKIGATSSIAVCSNGAITLDLATDSVLSSTTFDPTREIEMLHEAIPEAAFAVETLHAPRRLTAPFPEGELTGPCIIVPIEDLSVPDATRLTVRALDLAPEELLDRVNDVGLRGVEYAIGWTAWLDVSPEGVSKASGLEGVRERFGVRAGHTVAVGDGGNDREMLTWAGLGVAMGNAPESVRMHADTVTDDVDSDGLAILLEELL